MVYPTHGAGLAVLDRDLVDLVVDDRLRAPPRPAPAPDGGRRVRPRAAGRPADGPALLRPDATAQPGGPAAARRGRPRGPVAVRRRAGERPRARPAHRRCALAARPCRRPHPGLAVDPGRLVVRDVARLGGRTRPADHPARRGRRRPRRPVAPGAAHRVRPVHRLRRRRHRRLATWRAPGRGRRRPLRRDARRAARGRRPGGAVRHRCPAAVRVRGRPRPGLDPHRRGRAPRDARPPPARPPDRDDLRQRLPHERRGLDAPRPPVSRTSSRSRAASRPGRRTASRWRTARHREARRRKPRPPLGEGHAH